MVACISTRYSASAFLGDKSELVDRCAPRRCAQIRKPAPGDRDPHLSSHHDPRLKKFEFDHHVIMSVGSKRELLAAFEKLERQHQHGSKISKAVDVITNRHASLSSNSSTTRLKKKKRQSSRHRHSMNLSEDPKAFLPSTLLLSGPAAKC